MEGGRKGGRTSVVIRDETRQSERRGRSGIRLWKSCCGARCASSGAHDLPEYGGETASVMREKSTTW